MKAADAAFKTQDYDLALAKLAEADLVAEKTPFDQFKIDEYRAHVYIAKKSWADVIPIYERFLANPEFVEPQALDVMPKQLTQMTFSIQQYDKVPVFAKRWLETHPDDTQIIDLMARASYLTKDYPTAYDHLQTAITAAEKAGATPQEIWFQLSASCASNLDKEPQVVAAYQKMVRYYPKDENWRRLLERTLNSEKHEMGVLNTFRLLSDTNAINKADHYMEYAQLANDNALPGEAYKVLQTGFDKGLLGGTSKDKAQQERKLAEVKVKAQADRAQLPDIEKESKGPKATGQLLVAAGLAYFSFDMNDQAIESLSAGLAKGGVRSPDDARMVLGIALLRAGQKEKAREQFQAVPTTAPLASVANLWTIRTYN
jgi:hypothetical protein